MRSWKHTIFVALVVITILSLVLSACELIDNRNGNSKNDKDKGKDKEKGVGSGDPANPDKITICHKTGSTKNPYVEITVANDSTRDGHATHAGDIIPAPEGGCPSE